MSWTAFLDAYEDRLDRAERALSTGTDLPDDVLDPYEAPTSLGPFPAELGDRAQSILERNTALVESFRMAMGDLRNELNTLQKETSAARGYAPQANLTVSQFFDRPV